MTEKAHATSRISAAALRAVVKVRLRRGTASVLVDWAVQELMEGADGEQLRILAGMPAVSLFEVEEQFRRVLAERGEELPGQDEMLREYARMVAEEMVAGRIMPQSGVVAMFGIASELDYPDDMMVWVTLEDDYELLRTEGRWPELDVKAIEEARRMLAAAGTRGA